MRTFGIFLLFALSVRAGDAVQPVDDEQAKAALEEFEQAFRTKDVEVKQDAVYDLHDLPNDLVLARLEKVLKDKSPAVRNVAALALGGQNQNVARAGKALMRAYTKDFKREEVLSSVLDAIGELHYMGYWPKAKPCLKDSRNSIVIRMLAMLGANKDYRALPTLLDMYKVAMPKRISWSTGVVNVDTGASGDTDQKAAEAKWRAKYGRGGSKMKAKAKAKAAAFDERNFQSQLRKCVKAITGQDFDTSIDFEDWYVDNYVAIMRKIAVLDGKNPAAAEAQARSELPDMKRKIEEERRKLEEELAKERGEG